MSETTRQHRVTITLASGAEPVALQDRIIEAIRYFGTDTLDRMIKTWLAEAKGPRGGWRSPPGLEDLDPHLVSTLRHLTDRYGPLGVRHSLDQMYPIVDLKAVYNEYVPAEERKNFVEVLPIERVVIDELTIKGDQFEMGSLQHDVNLGTVTIKFVGVRKLETVYKHMPGGTP